MAEASVILHAPFGGRFLRVRIRGGLAQVEIKDCNPPDSEPITGGELSVHELEVFAAGVLAMCKAGREQVDGSV